MNPQSSVFSLPYEIKESEQLGRYLIASRDLEPLEILICEKPLACAPADDPNYESLGKIPMCLGCFARCNNARSSTCSKCGWPVCDRNCESITHHRDNECPIFASNNISPKSLPFKHLTNETIFILRCLLLKQKNIQVWTEIVMKFEHHTTVRMAKPECTGKDTKVIANLHELFKQYSEKSEAFIPFPTVDEDEVIKISGILNVNAFSSTKLEDECRSVRVRRRVTVCQCLYPTASLIAHQCIPNSSWTVSASPNFEQTIRTTVKISKGEMISIAYATREVMWATLQRLVSTSEVAHFICQCPRCLDPTERGTFIGAIKCSDCIEDQDGYLLPDSPTVATSRWKCSKCQSQKSVAVVVKMLNRIERQFDRIKNSAFSSEEEIAELEELYEESIEQYLHPNHYLLLEISLRIVNRNAFSLYYLDPGELTRFLHHCLTLLKVSEVLSPGYCRTRAIVQFYASQALMVSARKEVTSGSKVLVDKSRLLDIFKPIYETQKEAYLYFKTEDDNENRYKAVRGFNQYVVCLMEEMEECLKYMQRP